MSLRRSLRLAAAGSASGAPDLTTWRGRDPGLLARQTTTLAVEVAWAVAGGSGFGLSSEERRPESLSESRPPMAFGADVSWGATTATTTSCGSATAPAFEDWQPMAGL